MTDEADKAQISSDRLLEAGIAAHRGRGHLGDGEKECIDCGEEIPEKRRKAAPGCERCIECQANFEGEK